MNDGALPPLRERLALYGIEAVGTAIVLVVAGAVTMAVALPGSPLHDALAAPLLRRFCVGLVMAATIVSLVYSRYGMRSGAHLNPAVTVAFYRLGKVSRTDATCYVLAQFLGASVGVGVLAAGFRMQLADPAVRWYATVPGDSGIAAAFLAETALSFILFAAILICSNAKALARYTGCAAALLVCLFITFEAPISGMSLNPARTFGTALGGGIWDALWLYFTAPPLGMLLAAETFVRVRGRQAVRCAKLHHGKKTEPRCIFSCTLGSDDA